jgi:hypothetical protein
MFLKKATKPLQIKKQKSLNDKENLLFRKL